MEEKPRSSPRHRVLKAGQIRFGSTTVDCTIRNVSEAGAAISIKSPVWFPDKFTLVMLSVKSSRPCHIVWRKEGQMGVAFDD